MSQTLQHLINSDSKAASVLTGHHKLFLCTAKMANLPPQQRTEILQDIEADSLLPVWVGYFYRAGCTLGVSKEKCDFACSFQLINFPATFDLIVPEGKLLLHM